MKITLYLKKVISLALLAVFPVVVSAQNEARENRINAAIFTGSTYDENPLRASDDEFNVIRYELVYNYGVALDANYTEEHFSASASYRISREDFEKESQVDRNVYTGGSDLTVGDDTSFYQILASHQVRRQLDSPDAAEARGNFNEVATISLEPQLRTNPNKLNQARLTGLYQSTDFKDNQNREDVEQLGFQFELIRKLPNGKSIYIRTINSESEFDGLENQNFEYSRYLIGFSGTSNFLEYSFEIGANEIAPKIDGAFRDESGNTYRGAITVVNRDWELSSSFSSEISASSLVGVIGEDTSAVGGIQGSAGEEDQVKVVNLSSNLSSGALCLRCEFFVAYSQQKVTNFNFSENDTELSLIGSGFGFRLSEQASINFGYEFRQTMFLQDSTRDIDTERFRANLDLRLSQKLNIEFYSGNERVKGDARSYDSNELGINLELSLN